MYGDGVITGKVPAIKQLIDHYGEYGEGVVGVKRLTPKTFTSTVRSKLNICTTMFLPVRT